MKREASSRKKGCLDELVWIKEVRLIKGVFGPFPPPQSLKQCAELSEHSDWTVPNPRWVFHAPVSRPAPSLPSSRETEKRLFVSPVS